MCTRNKPGGQRVVPILENISGVKLGNISRGSKSGCAQLRLARVLPLLFFLLVLLLVFLRLRLVNVVCDASVGTVLVCRRAILEAAIIRRRQGSVFAGAIFRIALTAVAAPETVQECRGERGATATVLA